MLVLSRKKNESVIIGDDITITIIDIRGDKVRLGFERPVDLSVHRKEVYEAIQAGSEPDEHRTPPAVPFKRVVLSERQVATIDRFRESIREHSGAELTREDAVDTLLTAFEAAGKNLPAFVYGAMQGPYPL